MPLLQITSNRLQKLAIVAGEVIALNLGLTLHKNLLKIVITELLGQPVPLASRGQKNWFQSNDCTFYIRES